MRSRSTRTTRPASSALDRNGGLLEVLGRPPDRPHGRHPHRLGLLEGWPQRRWSIDGGPRDRARTRKTPSACSSTPAHRPKARSQAAPRSLRSNWSRLENARHVLRARDQARWAAIKVDVRRPALQGEEWMSGARGWSRLRFATLCDGEGRAGWYLVTSLLGVVWFGWPISLAIAATGSAVSLYLRAGHNGRPWATKATLAAGAVAVFVLPAGVVALGTNIGCSDGDPFFRWRLPGLVLVVLVAAALLGLWRLHVRLVHRIGGGSFPLLCSGSRRLVSSSKPS